VTLLLRRHFGTLGRDARVPLLAQGGVADPGSSCSQPSAVEARVKRIEDLAGEGLPEVIEHQAKQGVEYMTIHASVRLEQLLL